MPEPHAAMVSPFIALLASIALMPFFASHWWERNYARVSIGLGPIVVAYYLLILHDGPRMLGDPHLSRYVVAVSLGSVFFGAVTYLGNGPNFMLKHIAEASGVKCPSFFGHLLKFSLPVLIPLFAVVSLLLLG